MPNSRTNIPKNIFILMPLFGIIAFVLLYYVATFYYPGGSNVDTMAIGFDWFNNYWCELTDKVAKNGKTNPARPIALMAMLLLCLSLAMFWYLVPKLFKQNQWNVTIPTFGISSMMVTLFLHTSYHDIVIFIAGALGIFALMGVFIGLYRNKMTILLGYGGLCLLLMLINYFIYKTKIYIVYLPVIQKATFTLFLLWICLIDIYLYRKVKAET